MPISRNGMGANGESRQQDRDIFNLRSNKAVKISDCTKNPFKPLPANSMAKRHNSRFKVCSSIPKAISTGNKGGWEKCF